MEGHRKNGLHIVQVTYRMCGLHASHFDGGQGPRDCLYRCSTGIDTSRTIWDATIPGRNPASFAIPKSYTVHLFAVPTVLNENRYKSNHLARNHPRKEPSPIRRPKAINSSSLRCGTRKELPGYNCQRYSPRTRGLLRGGEQPSRKTRETVTKDTPLEFIRCLLQVRRPSHKSQQALEWVRSNIPRDHTPAF